MKHWFERVADDSRAFVMKQIDSEFDNVNCISCDKIMPFPCIYKDKVYCTVNTEKYVKRYRRCKGKEVVVLVPDVDYERG